MSDKDKKKEPLKEVVEEENQEHLPVPPEKETSRYRGGFRLGGSHKASPEEVAFAKAKAKKEKGK